MKAEKCGCFSNVMECPENDCEWCPARLKSEAEIREQAITEFAEKLIAELIYTPVSCAYDYAYEIAMVDARKKVNKIATELKGE